MKRPPLMFAAIVILVFLILLTVLGFWNEVFRGWHLTGNPTTP